MKLTVEESDSLYIVVIGDKRRQHANICIRLNKKSLYMDIYQKDAIIPIMPPALLEIAEGINMVADRLRGLLAKMTDDIS